ncbi:MAG: signal peptidase II [Chloroflexota bacterium]|mgnify:CR=1 FL=1
MRALWDRAGLLLVAAITLLLDQATKALVVRFLSPAQTWNFSPLLARWVSITYVTNTGAAFGLFPDQGFFFIIVALVVVAVIILYYRRLPAGQWLIRLALGLQLGGALGNLLDRLRYGYVVDFVDLNFWPLKEWPVFNVADASIVLGVVLLALTILQEESHARADHLSGV